MASNNGLGQDYDISIGLSPVDTQGGANTGKRINMSLVKSVDVVVIKGAGIAGDDPTVTVRAHTASTGGTSADLDVVTEYHVKRETSLDGDEAWETFSQTAGDIVDPGGDTTSAEEEQIVVFNVRSDQMPTDKNYLSVDIPDTGLGGAQLASVIYIIHHHDKNVPSALRVPLR